jgi:hypothetical protein
MIFKLICKYVNIPVDMGLYFPNVVICPLHYAIISGYIAGRTHDF